MLSWTFSIYVIPLLDIKYLDNIYIFFICLFHNTLKLDWYLMVCFSWKFFTVLFPYPTLWFIVLISIYTIFRRNCAGWPYSMPIKLQLCLVSLDFLLRIYDIVFWLEIFVGSLFEKWRLLVFCALTIKKILYVILTGPWHMLLLLDSLRWYR